MVLALAGVLGACGASTPPASESETGGQGGGDGSGGKGASGGSGGKGANGGSGGQSTPAQGGAPGSGGSSAGGSTPTADADVTPPADAAPTEDALPGGGDDAQGTVVDPGDQIPDRPLNVDKTNPQVYTIHWKPTDVDPASTGKNETQTALVDTSKTMQKKLVIVLAGSNGAPGPIGVANYVAGLGFHAYAIAYHDEYNASQGTNGNPEMCTNSRFNELDGMGRKPSLVTVPRADSVEERMLKALPYLQKMNPQGDWAYYLQKDGTIRWSDVIFIGHSHGATSSSAYAKIRRVWRAISLSGPRDDNPQPATWLTMKSATPMDRYYGFTGMADAQYNDHVKSMELQMYPGTLTSVEGAQPPYGNTHRLRYNGGHGGSANCSGAYSPVCKYMLGVQ